MKHLNFGCVLTLLVCLTFASTCSAALSLSLSPSNSNLPAEGGTVTLVATISGTDAEILNGYDLFFDISSVDLNATNNTSGPVILSNFVQLSLTTGTNFFDPQVPGGDGRDFGVSGISLTSGDLTTGGLNLFSFDANFGANSTNQPLVFRFDYQLDAAGSGLTANDNLVDLGTVMATGASVAVAAVPEPSSLAVVALFALPLMGRKRARR